MTNVHTLQSDSKTHVHTLQQFDKFFKKKGQICVIVVFNNVNTVRSEMWVLVFPHHSCQKILSNHESKTSDLTLTFPFNIVKNYYSKETVEQWPMYTLYKVTVKLMYTLYNNLTNFSKKKVKSA